jgi:hypothetical protein
MEKQHPNPLTLADLKEALKGVAPQEDLNALAPQEMVSTVMEAVAETKEGVTELKGLMQDMLEELTATHEDVRYFAPPSPRWHRVTPHTRPRLSRSGSAWSAWSEKLALLSKS